MNYVCSVDSKHEPKARGASYKSVVGWLAAAEKRIRELEAAIRKHQSQTGNNLCWENDLELWSVLPEGAGLYPIETLPQKEDFLTNCEAYYCSRLKNRKESGNEQG